MNSETSLVLEIWDLLLENIPANKRADNAVALVKIVEEFGFDQDTLAELVDCDDTYMEKAFKDVFEIEEEYDDEDYEE